MLTKIKFLTAGESHGEALIGIIQGIPAGLEITKDYINNQLARRQLGYGRGGRMKIESDQVRIISGVRHGKTIGSPISIIIENKDYKNWIDKMGTEATEDVIRKITLPRPGHADLSGIKKYDFDDIRNVIERSSARETAMRVALGAICKKFLKEANISIQSRVLSIGSVIDGSILDESDYKVLNKKVDGSKFRCFNKKLEHDMVGVVDECKLSGDTIGGTMEVVALGLPYGLGSYIQWDKKLNAIVASLMLSINAFKSLTIGSTGNSRGSQYHDEIAWDDESYKRLSNSAGGIEGGMSNSCPLILNMSMKPIPTLSRSLKSVDINTKVEQSAHKERSDVCAVPAASIIAEHMLSFAIADTILDKFGGDSIKQFKAHLKVSAKY
jgi:chorismate synthase